MADTENPKPHTLASLWHKIEKLQHPHFRKRLEGIQEAQETADSFSNGHIIDQVEEELIRLANHDENPAVRDAAFHHILKRGGPFALGIGFAVGAAYLGTKLIQGHQKRSKEEIAKIFGSPAAHEPKKALRVGEEAIRFGRGKEFVENLLGSLEDQEIALGNRQRILLAISSHSPLGAELYRHRSIVTSRIDKMPPELQEPLQKLLNQAKGVQGEKEKLAQYDLKNLM